MAHRTMRKMDASPHVSIPTTQKDCMCVKKVNKYTVGKSEKIKYWGKKSSSWLKAIFLKWFLLPPLNYFYLNKTKTGLCDFWNKELSTSQMFKLPLISCLRGNSFNSVLQSSSPPRGKFHSNLTEHMFTGICSRLLCINVLACFFFIYSKLSGKKYFSFQYLQWNMFRS